MPNDHATSYRRLLRALRRRHRGLDRRIEDEGRRPAADSLALTMMKKQRLRLRDRILMVEAQAVGGGSHD